MCTIRFSLIWRPILLPDTGLVQSGFQIIIIILWKITHAKFDSHVRPYQLYPTGVKFEEKEVWPYSQKTSLHNTLWHGLSSTWPNHTTHDCNKEREHCHSPQMFLEAVVWSGFYGDADTFCHAPLRVPVDPELPLLFVNHIQGVAPAGELHCNINTPQRDTALHCLPHSQSPSLVPSYSLDLHNTRLPTAQKSHSTAQKSHYLPHSQCCCYSVVVFSFPFCSEVVVVW